MTRKTDFLSGGLVQVQQFGTGTRHELEIYTTVAKGLKLKVRKFWRLIIIFVEVTGEKLEGGRAAFCSPILNRVKLELVPLKLIC